MNRIAALLAVVMLSLAAGAAHAGTVRIDCRQGHQHARIHQGVRSGQLTRLEAMRLRVGQRHVRRMERRAAVDGAFTRRERARIEWAQDRQSRRIYRLKHNVRNRG